MVIKDDTIRKSLWELHFRDGLSGAECVRRLRDANLASQTQVYATLDQFKDSVCWRHEGRKCRKLCAGGLTSQELRQLKTVIDEDPNRLYWQIQSQMDDQFNVKISITQISLAIATSPKDGGLGYSHHVKQYAAGEKDHAARVQFLQFLRILLPDWSEEWHKVVFFDEMHRGVREGAKRTALGPKGTRAVSAETFGPEARQTFTLIAAINTSGVIPLTPMFRPEGVDSDLFYLWVRFHLCPMLGSYAAGEPNSIVLCDNVNQHLDERAKEAIRSTGALLVFMPTYSPEWNPIEFLFHYLKHIWTPQNLTKYSGANAAADCMLDGCHAVDFKRSMGFFQHAGYKVPVHKDSDEAAALLLLALLADSD